MPCYSMICDACEHKFEVVHAMSEPHPARCRVCGKKKVRQDYVKPAAFHAHWSPMAPRANRGRGY